MADKIEKSQEFTLRAMAANYSDGHSWDYLDTQVCEKAADEIRYLRALNFQPTDDLRDRFACHAVQGAMVNLSHPSDIARKAYAVADAMIAARKGAA